MKYPKIFMMLVLASTVSNLSAFAANSAGFSDQWAQRLKEQLSLTDDQTSKIQTILSQSQPASGVKPTKEERDAFFKAKKERMEQVNSQISSVLTDEQRTKFEQLQKDRNQRGGGWDNKRQGFGHGFGKKEHRGQPRNGQHHHKEN